MEELAAELEKKSHFALVAQEKIRDLRAKIDEANVEVRQTQGLLTSALSKHEETANELQEAKLKLTSYMDAVERQRHELARFAEAERSLRAELREAEQMFFDEQLKAVAKGLLDSDSDSGDEKQLSIYHLEEQGMPLLAMSAQLCNYMSCRPAHYEELA